MLFLWRPGRNSLHHACERGQLNVIKYLIELGFDINAKDKVSLRWFMLLLIRPEDTPIHIASLEGQLETVKYLVEKGANVNEKKKSDWVYFPLIEKHLFFVPQRKDTLKLLSIWSKMEQNCLTIIISNSWKIECTSSFSIITSTMDSFKI